MSIEKEDSITRFTCDMPGCRKNYEGVDGFGSAWKEAKAHGWVLAEVNGEFQHYCKECGGKL